MVHHLRGVDVTTLSKKESVAIEETFCSLVSPGLLGVSVLEVAGGLLHEKTMIYLQICKCVQPNNLTLYETG